MDAAGALLNRQQGLKSFPIPRVLGVTAVKEFKVTCDFLRILVPNVKPKAILTLQQRRSLVWIDMALSDYNNVFAKPAWSMILGEGIKLPPAPMAAIQFGERTTRRNEALFKASSISRGELITICNAFRVAPDLRALRPSSLNS
jgi:hypothetical protein